MYHYCVITFIHITIKKVKWLHRLKCGQRAKDHDIIQDQNRIADLLSSVARHCRS